MRLGYLAFNFSKSLLAKFKLNSLPLMINDNRAIIKFCYFFLPKWIPIQKCFVSASSLHFRLLTSLLAIGYGCVDF